MRAGCTLQSCLPWPIWAGSNCLRREVWVMAGIPSYVDCSFCDQNLLNLYISHSFRALLSFIQHIFLFFYILCILSNLFLARIFTFPSRTLSCIYSCMIFLDSVLDGGHMMVYDLDPEILLLPPTLRFSNHSCHLLPHWKTFVSKTHNDMVVYSYLSNQSLFLSHLSQQNLLF